jgi:hypothetical protein
VADEALSAAERAFLERYCGGAWQHRHPPPTPANLALAKTLEERGVLRRKVDWRGFVTFELTPAGEALMRQP